MKYNSDDYYFQKNAQGDIIRIYDSDANLVGQYVYDTWGKVIKVLDGEGNNVEGSSSHIANRNPFRYRGYYYDVETGFYYLNSRYYDPDTCRSINADTQLNIGEGVLGCNMHTYCRNNPVNGYDPCGTCFHRWDFWNDCDKCGGKNLGTKIGDASSAVGNVLVSA